MDLSEIGHAIGDSSLLRHVATLVRTDIREGHRPAVIGVSYCWQCGGIGTIVDMRKCCIIAEFIKLGSRWDAPAAKWRGTRARQETKPKGAPWRTPSTG